MTRAKGFAMKSAMKSTTVCVLSCVLFAVGVVVGCNANRRASNADGLSTTRGVSSTGPSTMATSRPSRFASLDPVWSNFDEAYAMLSTRPDWREHGPMSLPRHPAEKHLKGLVIVLDPGHGMSDGKTDPKYKRGPTGVREDDMNLRVGMLLKRLLEEAGAVVVMTRETDALVNFDERAGKANDYVRADGSKGADLFISLHHNAAGPTANYSSVWYHGEVDWNGVELDVGKSIGHALGRHLRTDAARTNPLLSDQLMYKSGFGMLRQTNVPAILLESSFFSHPEEEQRLADAVYNLREAYAIYEGLCEWAYQGRPTQSVTLAGSVVSIVLEDGLPPWWGRERNRIETSTISVTLGGEPVAFKKDKNTLTMDLPGKIADDAVLEVRFKNMLGNSNYPTRFTQSAGQIRAIGPERAKLPATRPGDPDHGPRAD